MTPSFLAQTKKEGTAEKRREQERLWKERKKGFLPCDESAEVVGWFT